MRIVPSADVRPKLAKKSANKDVALRPAAVEVGEDLRKLRKETRRELDLEDPFR
jgi:hypothetical protein